MSTTNDSPQLIDQDFFAMDNANGNGTGQVGLDLAGGRVFALNSNNGILAVAYAPPLRFAKNGSQAVLTWFGPAILQSADSPTGPWTNVTGASSPYTHTGANKFFRLSR